MYAVFDKNKNFLSFSDKIFPTNNNSLNFFFKKIPEDKSDLLKWRWDGDYETGNMVAIEKNPYPDVHAEKFFEKKYSFYALISIMLKQIFLNSEKLRTTEYVFQEMVKDYITSFEDQEEYITLLRLANKLKNEKEN